MDQIFGLDWESHQQLKSKRSRFRGVKQLARRALEFWGLADFVVLRSSEGSYQVVFDRPVSWRENMQVVAWTVLDSGCEELKRWLVMQCRKGFLRCVLVLRVRSRVLESYAGRERRKLKLEISYNIEK